MNRSTVIVACVCAWLTACATTGNKFAAGIECAATNFTVDDQFDGARRGQCRVLGDRVQLTITPEDEGKINDSAWFAFRLIANEPARADIELVYVGGHHRYSPKRSTDSMAWEALPAAAVTVDKRGRRARFSVDVGVQPVFVAGQALVLPQTDKRWLDAIGERMGSVPEPLGRSLEGRPIHALETGAELPDVVYLVGRQHPPEVTGSFGFKGFVEAVMGDTPLAREFRANFGVVMVPMMNPDGVVAGHWRHNQGGMDLNRDWGGFTQPETRSVLARIDQHVASGRRPQLFLDFHSTRRNVFYTQPDGDPSEPTDFALRWLGAAQPDLQDYPFDHARRHNAGLPTSKNYINERFGIPAITYEVGDTTTRDNATRAAHVFAAAMMRLLLERQP
ncbi:MAG: M14 family metallopeptidase [Gammaproteobacteria bacterium]